MRDDLNFLSKKFIYTPIPKDKNYLFKYFKTDIQKQFLKYYFIFGTYKNFMDHTGYFCQTRWLIALCSKLEALEAARILAKKNFDFEMLVKIESGQMILKDL